MAVFKLERDTPGVVTIDDRDTRIGYSSSGWLLRGNATFEYLGSTHGANQIGAQANFTFTGTSIAVYGTFGTEGETDHPPQATYAIDDRPVVRGSGAVTMTSSPVYNQLFFQSLPLEDREHLLVITVSVDHGARYWLDYLLYMPTGSDPADAPALSISQSSPVPTGTALIDSTRAIIPTSRTSRTRSSPLLPSSSPNDSGDPPFVGPQSPPVAAAANAKRSNAGAIAGGVLGSLALLTLLLAIFFYRRRRNSRAPVFTNARFSQDPPAYPFAQSQPQYRYDTSIQKSARLREQTLSYMPRDSTWDAQSATGRDSEYRPDRMSYEPPSSVQSEPSPPVTGGMTYPSLATRTPLPDLPRTPSESETSGSGYSELYLSHDDPIYGRRFTVQNQ